MTDVELDERVKTLEENGGDANGKEIDQGFAILQTIWFFYFLKLLKIS